MSRRRINTDTGKPELTYREQAFINEYIENGGNGKDAAIAAGYGSARADQSAYQVLHRLQVQQHIQDRISEATVSADEIIGTLVSFMRGNIAHVLDDDGNFDIRSVKERRLGHLLKTVTRTTRRIKTQPGQPPELAQDYRIQLHSPMQAASILARLKGLNRGTPDFQSGDSAARESQPDSPPADYFTNSDDSHSQSPAVDYLTECDDSRSNLLPVDYYASPQHDPAGPLPDEYLAPKDPPVLTGEPRPALQPSAFNPQPSDRDRSPQAIPPEQLKQIAHVIKNLRKINPTQCLDQDLTQHAAPSPLPGLPDKTLIAPP